MILKVKLHLQWINSAKRLALRMATQIPDCSEKVTLIREHGCHKRQIAVITTTKCW